MITPIGPSGRWTGIDEGTMVSETARRISRWVWLVVLFPLIIVEVVLYVMIDQGVLLLELLFWQIQVGVITLFFMGLIGGSFMGAMVSLCWQKKPHGDKSLKWSFITALSLGLGVTVFLIVGLIAAQNGAQPLNLMVFGTLSLGIFIWITTVGWIFIIPIVVRLVKRES